MSFVTKGENIEIRSNGCVVIEASEASIVCDNTGCCRSVDSGSLGSAIVMAAVENWHFKKMATASGDDTVVIRCPHCAIQSSHGDVSKDANTSVRINRLDVLESMCRQLRDEREELHSVACHPTAKDKLDIRDQELEGLGLYCVALKHWVNSKE